MGVAVSAVRRRLGQTQGAKATLAVPGGAERLVSIRATLVPERSTAQLNAAAVLGHQKLLVVPVVEPEPVVDPPPGKVIIVVPDGGRVLASFG